MSKPIRGGYYLKARCIEQSDVAHAPPHAREVFDYFQRKAFWQDGDKLKRGQLLTSYKAIQDDLRWYVGNRPERYKRHEIETAVKLLARAGAVTTARTTRGMIVTVCNYERFQTPDNYESHSETVLKPTRDRRESPTIDEEGRIKEGSNTSTPAPAGFPHDLFARFQKAHTDCGRVRDFEFQAALAAFPGADVAEAVTAFERQIAGAVKLPYPVREFEKYLRRSVRKEDGGREFPKNAAHFSADEEQHRAAITARLQQRPAGEVSPSERMKQKAAERARKQREASTHEESEG